MSATCFGHEEADSGTRKVAVELRWSWPHLFEGREEKENSVCDSGRASFAPEMTGPATGRPTGFGWACRAIRITSAASLCTPRF